MSKRRLPKYNNRKGDRTIMTQHKITDDELKAFMVACKKNNVLISKTPQKRVSSATIYSNGKKIVITKNLSVKKGKPISAKTLRAKIQKPKSITSED